MRAIAIDPGPIKSAWVCITEGQIMGEIVNNKELALLLGLNKDDNHHLAIEMIASYGMPVGKDVFETCVWVGRFIQAWGGPHTKVYRRDVKLHLCNSPRAKDSNIRQALIDKYPATGGGKTPQIGTKAQPGPLYGIKKDLWAALAVAVTWAETQGAQLDENAI